MRSNPEIVFTRWQKRIGIPRLDTSTGTKRHHLTKTEINALKKALNVRPGVGGLSDDQCGDLIELIELVKPHITAEQGRQGIEYLYRLAFTKTGKAPKDCPFTEYQRDIIANAHRTDPMNYGDLFRLVGMVDESTSLERHYGIRRMFPIYRLECDGQSFDYVGKSWQAGASYVL